MSDAIYSEDGDEKHAYLNNGNSEISLNQINGDVKIVKDICNNEVINTDQEPIKNVDGAPTLKRTISLFSGVTIIVGAMIGSGIFISPKGVLRGTGSVGACLCVWLGCGILSLFGALCFVELGSLIRLAGGEYAYLLKAFGGFTRFFGQIPSFLYVWTYVLMIGPARLAVISLAFADYTTGPMFDACLPPDFIKKMLAIACILLITLINCASVKAALFVQNFFTAAKVIALSIISIGGIVRLAQGNVMNFSNSFEGTIKNPSTIALACYNGLWAYGGWNNLNFVTEEIKNPKRNLPLAIAISVPLVTLLYLLVNVSYFTVMSKYELLASPAVAVTWGNNALGVMAWIIPLSVAFSTFGACNAMTISSSRVVFASAREGHMLSMLSSIHVLRFTPVAALIFNAIIAVCMALSGSISTLINFLTVTSWIFYGLTFLSVTVLRFTMKDANRQFKVPIPIPIICVLVSIYLVVAPIIDNPAVEFLYAFMFTIAGLFFYVPFVFFRLRIPGIGYLTDFVLLFLESAPSSTDETSIG